MTSLISLFVFYAGFYLITFYSYYLNYLDKISAAFESPAAAEYDYIIVGCGTAGSLISKRFIEREMSFLCLEAGGSGGTLFDIPILGPILHGSQYDWRYSTVKQENACAAMDRSECKWTSGKIVGGSSRLNNMVHIRGQIEEYMTWFGALYNRSYFEEQFNIIEKIFVPVERIRHRTILSDAILLAAKSLGFPVHDLNKNSSGFSETMVNQKNGARWTTSHGITFSNHVVTNAHVEKIIIDSKTRVAHGVNLSRFGQRYSIYARKGVIVSSGAVGSAKLLLLSGIGPKEHLQQMNIEVINDLKVGHNLQDHITTGLDLVFINKSLSLDAVNILNPMNAWNYFINGLGIWTIPGCEAIAILQNITSGNNTPELQLMVLPVGLTSEFGLHLKSVLGISESTLCNYFTKFAHKRTVSILPVVLHPKSRGVVQLQTNDPNDDPLIDPKYLSNSYDSQILLEGINFIKKMLKTDAMASLGAELNSNIFPGCEIHTFDTESYWRCYLKHFTFSSYHPAGTCKMGIARDIHSVVDHNFKVHALKNLYVVDASVLPSLPSSNINTAVAMMAQIFVNSLISSFEASSQGTCSIIFSEYIKQNLQCYIHN